MLKLRWYRWNRRRRRWCPSLERALLGLEAGRLGLQPSKPRRLRLQTGWLKPKPSLLRLLDARVACGLGLLEARRSLTGKACRLRGQTRLKSLLLELLLLRIEACLSRILKALPPLRHFAR